MQIYRRGTSERISADDPAAATKIRARIEALEALVNNATRANDIVAKNRKISTHSWAGMSRAELARMGVDAEDIERILRLSPQKRYGVPYGEIVASKADIDRLKKRLESLEKARAAPQAAERRVGPARIVENREANRLQVFFDDKPAEAVRGALRARGFKWAPSVQAWQRQLTAGAHHALEAVLRNAFPAAPSREVKDPVPAAYEREVREYLARTAPPREVTATAPPREAAASPQEGSTLRSWLDDAPKTLAARVARTWERAKKQGKGAFSRGKTVLEVVRKDGVWTVQNRAGEPVPYVRSGRKAKLAGPETQREFNARMTRERDQSHRRGEREARQKTRKSLAEQKKKTRSELLTRAKEAKALCRVEVKDARSKTRPSKRRLAAAVVRTRCAAREAGIERSYDERITKLEAQMGELRPPRRARVAEAYAPKRAGKARENLQERDDQVRSELVRQGRADLVPVWNGVKDIPRFKGLSADRAWEKFSEFIEEDANSAVDAARAAATRTDDDHACEEAVHRAADDPQIALWASENCEPDGKPRTRKLSPEERTLTFLGLPNPADANRRAREAAKDDDRKAKRKPPPGPARGQQSLGSTWTPLVDAGGSQLSLDRAPVPRAPRAALARVLLVAGPKTAEYASRQLARPGLHVEQLLGEEALSVMRGAVDRADEILITSDAPAGAKQIVRDHAQQRSKWVFYDLDNLEARLKDRAKPVPF